MIFFYIVLTSLLEKCLFNSSIKKRHKFSYKMFMMSSFFPSYIQLFIQQTTVYSQCHGPCPHRTKELVKDSH